VDTLGPSINSGIITALAAIAGSLVGALGSAVATWITARHQDRRDLLGKQIERREALYSDFIGESARLLVDAMQYNVSDLQKLVPVYALLSRIRLSSSEPVLQTAENVIKTIVNTYPQPNLTADQIESQAMNGQDPLGSSVTPVASNWSCYNDKCRLQDVIPADLSLCCVVKSARLTQNISIFSARGNVGSRPPRFTHVASIIDL